MSASLGLKFGVVAAAISCLLAGSAAAQQTPATDPTQSAEARDDASNQSGAGQYDRSGVQQSGRLSTQNDRSAISGERRTANFRGATAAGSGNQEVEKFLAGCLLSQNQSEIELGQLAAKQAQNSEVKQFAQQMVKDHQQLVQQLQQVAGMHGGPVGARPQAERSTSSIELGTNDATPSDTASNTPSGTIGTNRNDLTGATQPSSGSGEFHQLAQIEKQIADRHKQAVMDELQQKQGAEFDKCYLGSAIGAHMYMNASLEVIGQHGEGNLSQLAQQAQPKVQQHLDHAKQLMQQLDGQTASTQDTNRAQCGTTTQRQ